MTKATEGIELPSARRVVERALCICVLHARALGEVDGEGALMLRWLERVDAAGELGPEERAFLLAPTATLSTEERNQYSWFAEGAVVLGWALGMVDLPPHDAMADLRAIWDPLGYLREPRAIIEGATLRPLVELEAYHEMAHDILWRLRMFASKPEAIDFAAACRSSGWASRKPCPIALVRKDLRVGRSAIRGASEQQRVACGGIAAERYRAIRWLLGSAVVYADVDLET